jgi:hypothetical protein
LDVLHLGFVQLRLQVQHLSLSCCQLLLQVRDLAGVCSSGDLSIMLSSALLAGLRLQLLLQALQSGLCCCQLCLQLLSLGCLSFKGVL